MRWFLQQLIIVGEDRKSRKAGGEEKLVVKLQHAQHVGVAIWAFAGSVRLVKAASPPYFLVGSHAVPQGERTVQRWGWLWFEERRRDGEKREKKRTPKF